MENTEVKMGIIDENKMIEHLLFIICIAIIIY